MHLSTLVLAIVPLAANAVNIVISNDDGWAETNIRTLYNTLKLSGHGVLISAPAIDQSGTGSLKSIPHILRGDCHYHTCPCGSPANGAWKSDSNITYVNASPATAMDYGIHTQAPKTFGQKPDLAIAGINVGKNSGIISFFSGTVGAAKSASKSHVPAIAFSGVSGHRTAWKAVTPRHSHIYASLATNFTDALLDTGMPYLRPKTMLNVNFPAVEPGLCDNVTDFQWVFSRVYRAVPLFTSKDISTCGRKGRLPTENDVLRTKGCYVSVSVMETRLKTTASRKEQKIVYEKLKGLLSCLPDDGK